LPIIFVFFNFQNEAIFEELMV